MEKIRENYFIGGNVLYAIELNTIIAKINEIIDKLKANTSGSSTTIVVPGGNNTPISVSEVEEKIQEAVEELHQLIEEAEDRLDQRIEYIENAEPGSTFEYDDEHLVQLFKAVINGEDGNELVNAVLLRLGAINENGEPYFDTTVLQKINNLETKVSTLELLPAQISLLVEHRSNGTNVVKPAAIIAAITDSKGILTSQVGISADRIVLEGETLTTELGGIHAAIQRIDAGNISTEGLETITANVTDKLVTEDLEVHGTLHYNRIIGNVTNVSSDTTLSDTAYYVNVTNSNAYNPITLTFPSSPVTGQTIFIGGSRFYKVRTTHYAINYFYDYIESAENYKHYLRNDATTGTTSETAQGFGWNGVVEFIFTGTVWQQLIHNISLSN